MPGAYAEARRAGHRESLAIRPGNRPSAVRGRTRCGWPASILDRGRQSHSASKTLAGCRAARLRVVSLTARPRPLRTPAAADGRRHLLPSPDVDASPRASPLGRATDPHSARDGRSRRSPRSRSPWRRSGTGVLTRVRLSKAPRPCRSARLAAQATGDPRRSGDHRRRASGERLAQRRRPRRPRRATPPAAVRGRGSGSRDVRARRRHRADLPTTRARRAEARARDRSCPAGRRSAGGSAAPGCAARA